MSVWKCPACARQDNPAVDQVSPFKRECPDCGQKFRLVTNFPPPNAVASASGLFDRFLPIVPDPTPLVL